MLLNTMAFRATMYLHYDATDKGVVSTFGPLWAAKTRLPERVKRFVHVKVQIYRLRAAVLAS
jgi:hypothetical protein